MKIKIILLIALVATLSLANFAQTANQAPFIGEWSNGRGFQLTVTESTLKLGANKAVRYKDVTKVSDGNIFYLQVINPGKMNYFSNFIAVTIDPDTDPAEMQLTFYKTYKNLFDGENEQGNDTFYRDGEDSDAN